MTTISDLPGYIFALVEVPTRDLLSLVSMFLFDGLRITGDDNSADHLSSLRRSSTLISMPSSLHTSAVPSISMARVLLRLSLLQY